MDVETFASGEEFLKAVEIRQFDCVLLDLHMPKISGHEVLSRLSRLATRIPAIVITGNDTAEVRARVLEAGAAAFLLKPVDGRALLDAVAATTAVQQGS